MAYNIKLFVHGVPDGQKIWGSPGSDAKYIEAFYGRKSSVSSQMLLEVMQFGGETNAYYTYYYNGKLQEKGGRSGGYFALTLRINYYYVDIQNIYNLLEAAFKKYIIGSVLENTAGGGCRFKISQFNQANDTLTDLENEMVHYLMRFSSDQDFVSLSGFKSNGQNECGMINLLEAAPNVVLTHVKSTGKISVSSLYPSSKEQQIIDKMNAEIKAVNSNAQQQISAVQQKAQQDVLTAQKEKEQGILDVKNEYKEADKIIKTLKIENDKAIKDNERLNREVQKLNNNLINAQEKIKNYDNLQNELNNRNAVLDNIKKEISRLGSIPTIDNPGSKKTQIKNHEKENSDYSWGREQPIQSGTILNIYWKKLIFPSILLLVIILIAISIFKSCNGKDNNSVSFSLFGDDKKEVVEQKGTELLKEQTPVQEASEDKEAFESSGGAENMVHETVESLKQKYPNARINIDPMDEAKGDFMRVSSGIKYTISLVEGDKELDLKGEWDCKPEDFHIYENNIIPKREGSLRIVYKVNGMEFVDKIVNVKL